MSRDESPRRRETHLPEDDDIPIERERGSSAEDATEDWDANDARRRHDHFAPPEVPCECWCMHCRRVFMSDGIWFQRVVGDPQGFEGFWKCPTPNCDGAGFTFDIFPTDPDHPANAGWSSDDGDEVEEDWESDEGFDGDDDDDSDGEWDPDEAKYKVLDEAFGNEDDDMEGEEWKYGLEPGERAPEPDWVERARREREEEERMYDQPDERPRVLDWSDRKDREPPAGEFRDDDIPF